MIGATPRALELVHKSGWMIFENFLLVLKFFKNNVRCAKEHYVLLVIDNQLGRHSLLGRQWDQNFYKQAIHVQPFTILGPLRVWSI